MVGEFSKTVRLWLEKQNLLHSVEAQFRREWAEMLEKVHELASKQEWKCGRNTELIQLYRDEWPASPWGVHYEALCNDEFLKKGIVDISLHVEQEVLHQDLVCAKIRQLLHPYKANIRAILADYAPNLPAEPIQDIIKGRLPLSQAEATSIWDALSRMAQTESFVDEAIFLSRKTPVWRTDLLRDDPKPYMKWHEGLGTGEEGGWEFDRRSGRLGSPCLKCHGDKSNYHEGKNILTLRKFHELFHDFSNGQLVYCSAIVHAADGGQIQFHAEAGKEGKWTTAFDAVKEVEDVDSWKLISWEGRVAKPDNYDFAEQGLHAFLMVKAPKSGLKIDSIEIGVREDQACEKPSE